MNEWSFCFQEYQMFVEAWRGRENKSDLWFQNDWESSLKDIWEGDHAQVLKNNQKKIITVYFFLSFMFCKKYKIYVDMQVYCLRLLIYSHIK